MGISVWEWLARLGLAALLGGLVGFERGSSNKAAGVRTNMMVGLGAATFTAVAFDGFGPGEASRIAATVVTGVGFLGAGAIFRHGLNVTGLTTAASLWTVAAIGVTAGAGELVAACIATGVALVILQGLHSIDAAVRRRAKRHGVLYELRLTDSDGIGPVLKMAQHLDEHTQIVGHRMSHDETILVLRLTGSAIDQIETAAHAIEQVVDTRIVDG